MIKEIFMCECHSEGVVVSYFDEEKEIYLALFNYAHSVKTKTFWERLRWCWNVLKTGEPWADEVILDHITAEALGNRLLEIVKNEKS